MIYTVTLNELEIREIISLLRREVESSRELLEDTKDSDFMTEQIKQNIARYTSLLHLFELETEYHEQSR